MLKALATAPKRLRLSPDEYRLFLNEVLRGKEPSLLKEGDAAREGRGTREASQNSGARLRWDPGHEALGKAFVTDLAEAKKIVATLDGRNRAVVRNPIAPRSQRMKAKKNIRKAKKIERTIVKKLKGSEKLAKMPQKFAQVAVAFSYPRQKRRSRVQRPGDSRRAARQGSQVTGEGKGRQWYRGATEER